MSGARGGQEPEPDDLDDILDDPDDLDPEPEPEPDDPDAEPQPEPEPEPEPEPRTPLTRVQRTVTRQQKRIQDLEDERRRLQDALLQRQPQPQAQQPDPARQAQLDQQELERVAQLPLEEQGRYWARKSEERAQQAMLRTNLETRDMLDRIQFQNLMERRKLPARYEQQVEALLGQARQNGMNPTREWLLNAVVGQEVLSRKGADTARQRQAAQRRVASQTVRAGGASRSTAAPASNRRGGNQAADDDALLRSITVGDFLNATGA